MILRIILILSAVALTAACGGGASNEQALNALDNQLAADADNAPDPALTAALEDQILVDSDLAQQSQRDVARAAGGPAGMSVPAEVMPEPATLKETGKLLRAPDPSPASADLEARPETLGALAARQSGGPDCIKAIGYSYQWAAKLPADMPLYPRARVSESAGADRPGCAARIIGFATGADLQAVLDFHYTRARQARFAATHEVDGAEHRLGGVRGNDAFVLFARARRGGGTEGELVLQTGG